jgi:hypothetical protein
VLFHQWGEQCSWYDPLHRMHELGPCNVRWCSQKGDSNKHTYWRYKAALTRLSENICVVPSVRRTVFTIWSTAPHAWIGPMQRALVFTNMLNLLYFPFIPNLLFKLNYLCNHILFAFNASTSLVKSMINVALNIVSFTLFITFYAYGTILEM